MIAFLAEYNAHNEIVIGMRLTSYSTHVVDNKKNILFLLPSMVDNQCY